MRGAATTRIWENAYSKKLRALRIERVDVTKGTWFSNFLFLDIDKCLILLRANKKFPSITSPQDYWVPSPQGGLERPVISLAISLA
ncbi:hypothetical protein KNHN1_16320 [Pseudomonas guariconensis]